MVPGSTHSVKSSATPSGSDTPGHAFRWCRRSAPQPPAILCNPAGISETKKIATSNLARRACILLHKASPQLVLTILFAQTTLNWFNGIRE